MAEKTVFTALSAAALDKEAWPATWDEISDFFIPLTPLLVCG